MPKGVYRCAGCREPVAYESATVVRRSGFDDGPPQKARVCDPCFALLAGDPRVTVHAVVATAEPIREAVAEIAHDARRRAELANAPELPPPVDS